MRFIFVLHLFLMPLNGRFEKKCANPMHLTWSKDEDTRTLIDNRHIPKEVKEIFEELGVKFRQSSYFCQNCINRCKEMTSVERRSLGLAPKEGPLKQTNRKRKHSPSEVDECEGAAKKIKPNTDEEELNLTDNSVLQYIQNLKTSFASKIKCYITGLQNKISDLCKSIFQRDCKIRDLENENENLKMQLATAMEENEKLNDSKEKLLESQEKRIGMMKQIISMEKDSIKFDINSRKANHQKLTNKSLLDLDSKKVLESHNPVLKTAIEEFTKSDTETGKGIYNSNQNLIQKKCFRRALICESILGTADLNYVSPLAFAPLLLSFSLTGSKSNCQVFAHTIPCGSYQNLQEFLTEKVDPPKAASNDKTVVYAFDNNQRIMRTWLCRNSNKQAVEIMTNILRMNLNNTQNIQFNKDLHPLMWRKHCLNDQFSLDFDELLNPEAVKSLTEITNSIFSDISNNVDKIQRDIMNDEISLSTITCPSCQTVFPKSKLKCNVCNIFIRKEITSLANQGDYLSTKITKKESQSKADTLRFHNYIPSENGFLIKEKSTNLSTDEQAEMNSSKFTLIDPLFVNPASLAAVEKVLEHIGKDAGIRSLGFGEREWAFVVCDGSPMAHVLRIIDENPEKFSWVVPIIGLGHEEMNMVKAFVEFSWDFIYKDFSESQGYKSPKSLAFAKSCGDHHISFDNLQKFREAVWYEIIFSFVNDPYYTSYTLENLFSWINEKNNCTLTFLVHTVMRYCESIFMFRKGVRTNDDILIQSARSTFRDLWYGRNHTKYQVIDFYNQLFRIMMPNELLDFSVKCQVASRSGRDDSHQGIDFVLEEFNKDIKHWVSGIPDSNKWTTAIQNHASLTKLRQLIHKLLSLPLVDSRPRIVPDYSSDRDRFRKILRKENFTSSTNQTLRSLDCKIQMTQSAMSFRDNCIIRFNHFLHFMTHRNFKYPAGRKIQSKIPLSLNEQKVLEKDSNRTKEQLLAMIDENMRMIEETIRGEWVSRFNVEKIKKSTKSVILQFLQEVREEVSGILLMNELD